MLHIVDRDKEFPLHITTVVQAEPWEKGHIARFTLHPFQKHQSFKLKRQNVSIE